MSGYGASRFDEMNSFGSSYTTPGWQRAQQRKDKVVLMRRAALAGPMGGSDENRQASRRFQRKRPAEICTDGVVSIRLRIWRRRCHIVPSPLGGEGQGEG